MAWQECDYYETDNTGAQSASTNTSNITVPASTWTKVCSINISSLAKGRYLVIGSIGHTLSLDGQCVYYMRITRDGSVDNTLLNTPYGSEHIIGAINTSNATSTIDLWIYAKAHTLTANYGALRLIRLFE